jgi:hypothetical protein
LAQSSPLGPAPCTPAAPNRRTLPVGASSPTRSPLSLARCSMGPTSRCRPHPRSRSFSRCPAGPACQPSRLFFRSPSLGGGSRLSDPSPPNRPCTTCVLPWTPHPRRTPRSRPSPPWPFSSRLAPARPPLPSFGHSQPSAPASHRLHAAGSSDAVCCDRVPVPPPPLGAHRVCCLGKLSHITRSSGHPLVHRHPL